MTTTDDRIASDRNGYPTDRAGSVSEQNSARTIGFDADPWAPELQWAPTPAPPPNPAVQRFEQRAQDAEHSPYPTLLKVGRAIVWIAWVIIAANAALLVVAFVLRLGGANTDAGFVDWVYRSGDAAMRPFRGIFPSRELGGASVFDASLLFAALAYVVAVLGLDGVNRWLRHKVAGQELEIARARATADAVALQFKQQQVDAIVNSATHRPSR